LLLLQLTLDGKAAKAPLIIVLGLSLGINAG